MGPIDRLDRRDPSKTPRLSVRNLGYVFFAALIGSLGTHMVDVLAVKGRVDDLQKAEQADNEARMRWENFENYELPAIRDMSSSMWTVNKRLCHILYVMGEKDPECREANESERHSRKAR